MIRHIRGHSNNGRPIRYSRAYQFYTVRAPPKMKYEDILILQDAFCKEHKQEAQCAQKGGDASFCHLWLYKEFFTKFLLHIANLSCQKL